MTRLAVGLGLALALIGCARERGTPTLKPLPEPDLRPPLRSPGARSPRIANYDITAKFDPGTRRVTAAQSLRWRNAGASPVHTLPFHLYMNAFKDENTVFMTESRGRHRRARVNPDAPGHIDISSIRIGAGPNLRDRATFPGPDETVMHLPLPSPVPPGASVNVSFEFEVALPEVFARTGYKRDFAMVAQWFPKIGVRVGTPGQETWHCEPFHFLSEFFADFGVYQVSITVPDTHVVAAGGVLTSAESNGDGTRTLSYRAEDVHDFAWMTDPYMEMLAGNARVADGEVAVRVYFRPGQRAFASRHLHAAIGTVEVMSETLVPYPYSIISVVDPPPDAASGAGGMEYPTLVTTSGDSALFGARIRFPELVTVHEVGHNWMQGILASNEVDEAWLDEGVNNYVNGWVFERLYDGIAIDWLGRTIGPYMTLRALFTPETTPITTRSYEFPHARAYGTATYTQTALALRTLENLYGRVRFRAAVKAYAQAYAFKHPTGADFFATLERELGEDLDWFVQPAFNAGGAVDFRVDDAHCGKKACRIVVVNRGTVPVPVDVLVSFADGTEERLRWGDHTFWKVFDLQRANARVASVAIDPENLVLLDQTPVSNHLRIEPDPTAARKVGRDAQFWTQTLMQGVGL